jgi:hypothetical protein
MGLVDQANDFYVCFIIYEKGEQLALKKYTHTQRQGLNTYVTITCPCLLFVLVSVIIISHFLTCNVKTTLKVLITLKLKTA